MMIISNHNKSSSGVWIGKNRNLLELGQTMEVGKLRKQELKTFKGYFAVKRKR
jgi:hypothetical protein